MIRKLHHALLCCVFAVAAGCGGESPTTVVVIPTGDGGQIPFDQGVQPDVDITPDVMLFNVQPNHGPFSGGTEVLLSGSGFVAGATVELGGVTIPPEDVTLIGPATLQIITPPGPAGPADITVTVPGSTDTLTGAFTYDSVYIDPPDGPTVGQTLVTIRAQPGIPLSSVTNVALGGQPLTDIAVVDPQTIVGRTPANPAGPSALSYDDAGTPVSIADAFNYYVSANTQVGGASGGPIAGSVTVNVLDALTRVGIDGAKVILQQGREREDFALTDPMGVATFVDDALSGAVTVSAAADGYDATTFAVVDARDITIFLNPPPPPPQPPPPGLQAPIIDGHISFGGPTGAGLAEWSLVPEPQGSQIKRAYVFVTNPTLRRHAPPVPRSTATIDYQPNGFVTAWPYSMFTRIGNMAVYAVAGLYDTVTEEFEPYAMGISRGVSVQAGDRRTVDVLIDMPLSRRIDINLISPPTAVNEYQVRLGIRLGTDGFLLREDMQRVGSGTPTNFAFSRQPHFTHPTLVDANYAADVVLTSNTVTTLPLVAAHEAPATIVNGNIDIDSFVGPALAISPQPGGPMLGNTLRWATQGAAADMGVSQLLANDGSPIWLVISRGDVTEINLPDPATFGISAFPVGDLIWSQFMVRIPEFDFNGVNYGHLSTSRWSRWSLDQFVFSVP